MPQALLYERRQNLRRFARDLPGAAAVIDEWIAAVPDDPLGYDMRGEVAFLRGDFGTAETAFGQALERYRSRVAVEGLNNFHGMESHPTRYYFARAELKLALTQARAGDRDQAQATYQQVIDVTTDLATAGLQGSADDHLIQTRYHALAQRGDLFLADQRYDEAVRSYDEAITLSSAVDRLTPGGEAMLTGAAESNRALALLRAGRAADSVASARQALARDADNPIFIEAYASALRETGDTEGGDRGVPGRAGGGPDPVHRAEQPRGPAGPDGPAPRGRGRLPAEHRCQSGLRLGVGEPGQRAERPAPAAGIPRGPGRVAARGPAGPGASVVRGPLRRWTRRCTRAISTCPGPSRRTGSSRPRPGRR